VGAHGSQNGKILRLQLPGEYGPLYMGPGGEGLGRGVRSEAVICLTFNSSWRAN
jgi:hypothetical protein